MNEWMNIRDSKTASKSLHKRKNTKWVKIRRWSTFLKARSAIAKARQSEYDWLWDGHMKETVRLMIAHNSLPFGVRAPLIQRWRISWASMPLPGRDCIFIRTSMSANHPRGIRMLSKLSILKSRRWKLNCLPQPRRMSIHRNELIKSVGVGGRVGVGVGVGVCGVLL